MLKQRVLTALILIPVVVSGILYLPHLPLEIFAAFVFVIAAFEWSRLAGFVKTSQRIMGFVAVLLFSMMINAVLVYSVAGCYSGVYWTSRITLISLLLFWLWVFLQILRYPKNISLTKAWRTILLGGITLGPAFLAIDLGINLDRSTLLYVLVLVWSADIGAYFAGKKFGKRKLAPLVSPGKSWEGVLGGLLAAFSVAVIAYFVMNHLSSKPFDFIRFISWVGTGMAAAVFSIVGDLWISLLKRHQNLKDTGALLPGHGGILDRIDGLLAAVSIYGILMLLQR